MKKILFILLAVLVMGICGTATADAKKRSKKVTNTSVNIQRVGFEGIFKGSDGFYYLSTDCGMTGRGNAYGEYCANGSRNVQTFDGMITGKNSLELYPGNSGQVVATVIVVNKNQVKINGTIYTRVSSTGYLKDYLKL